MKGKGEMTRKGEVGRGRGKGKRRNYK